MATWVALLRGINLGPSHKVPMADLRSLLADELGYEDVRTLVNSGNVVFGAAGSAAAHEKKIAATLEKRFGFAVPTIVRSGKQLRAVLDANPFPKAPAKELHVVFLSAQPTKALLPAPEEIAPDQAVAGTKCIYLRLPNGVARSKVGDLGKGRGAPVATQRTWNTVTKLADLAGA